MLLIPVLCRLNVRLIDRSILVHVWIEETVIEREDSSYLPILRRLLQEFHLEAWSRALVIKFPERVGRGVLKDPDAAAPDVRRAAPAFGEVDLERVEVVGLVANLAPVIHRRQPVGRRSIIGHDAITELPGAVPHVGVLQTGCGEDHLKDDGSPCECKDDNKDANDQECNDAFLHSRN